MHRVRILIWLGKPFFTSTAFWEAISFSYFVFFSSFCFALKNSICTIYCCRQPALAEREVWRFWQRNLHTSDRALSSAFNAWLLPGFCARQKQIYSLFSSPFNVCWQKHCCCQKIIFLCTPRHCFAYQFSWNCRNIVFKILFLEMTSFYCFVVRNC